MKSKPNSKIDSETSYYKGEKYLKKEEFEKAIKHFKGSINSKKEKEKKYRNLSFYGIIQSYIALQKINKANEYYDSFTNQCKINEYLLTYVDIIKRYRINQLVPMALDKVNSILSKGTFEELKFEKANCLYYLNRIKEASNEIEGTISLFQLHEKPLSEELIECYFIIKNRACEYLNILNMYYKYRNHILTDKTFKDSRRIFLELGIACISLNREEDLNKEVYVYFHNKMDENHAFCYKKYLDAYNLSINKKNEKGREILEQVVKSIIFYSKNNYIRLKDISIFYELFGNLNNNLEHHSEEAIENYYFAKCQSIECPFQLNIKIANAYYNHFVDGLSEKIYFTDKNISLSNFLKEFNALYQENETHKEYYNVLGLKMEHMFLLYKSKKDEKEISFKMFEEITKYLRNDNIRERYTNDELINIFKKYFLFLPIYNNILKSELFLFPQLIGSGRFSDVYYGELSKEDVAVKVYRTEKEKFNNKEYYKQELESAFMEISTMELIRQSESNIRNHIKIGYQYLLPIKCGLFYQKPKLLYLITPLCKGGTLYDLLSKPTTNLTNNEIKQILLSTAKGLQVLHELDMIHKDIRSSNIFLKNEYEKGKRIDIYIGGFDFIKGNKNCNNVIYAPEIKENNITIGKEVDIYAFGMLIWETFMKETQFVYVSRNDTYRKKRNNMNDYSRLSQKASSAMCQLFEKCIMNDPKRRPTIENVINELEYI